MKVRMLTVAMVVGVFWASVPAATASCGGGSPSAGDDPRAEYERADIVGIGQVVRTDADGNRTVHLTRTFKGGTSDIDIGPASRGCPDSAPFSKTGVFITRERGGVSVGTEPAAVTRAAARPLRYNGAGPAVLLETTASTRDPLATLDARGRIVSTAPPSTPYWGVSVCPGHRTVVAWKPDGHSVRLSLPDLRRLGRGPTARFRYRPAEGSRLVDARCNTRDGRVALVAFSGKFAILTLHRQRTLPVHGPSFGGVPQFLDARHVLLQSESVLEFVDVLTGRSRWRMHHSFAAGGADVSPDRRHALLEGEKGDNLTCSLIDLVGLRPHVRRLPWLAGSCPGWASSDRLIVQDRAKSSAIVDLRGHVVARIRGLLGSSFVARRWLFSADLDRLERAPRAGGSVHRRRLALWAAGLQSLSG